MDVVHQSSSGGFTVRFFRQNPDAVNASRPFGRETERVQAFLRAVSAAPRDRAPELLAAAAGWDFAERDRMVTLTIHEARTAGRLQDAAAVGSASEVAADRTALGAISVLVNPAAATAIEVFLRKLGPAEAGRYRSEVLKNSASATPVELSPDEATMEKLMTYYIALQYVVFQAALTLALRPFMPPERFAALWSPLGASPSWSA
jgi:hypothetical protein